MIRAARRPRGVVFLRVILPLLAGGCGQAPGPVTGNDYELAEIYAEPPETPEPALAYPRDLLAVGPRVYVLDGRLAHVAVFDAAGGELITVFGGPGEGPGELGAFPYALVSDGGRIGVAHLFQVSWFDPAGVFIARVNLPPLDLSTPSVQYSGDGWLVNAAYAGEGSPAALYISAGGDTVGFGESVAPKEGDAVGLAAMEINAVHAVRFENGNVLLGWVHRNRIELYSPDGRLIRSGGWTHLQGKVEHRPDGRVRGMPGYTFAATLGADGLAYLLDGTQQWIQAYGGDGKLRYRHQLRQPAARLAWAAGGVGYALNGTDRLYRLRDATASSAAVEKPLPAAWAGLDLRRALGALTDLSGEPVAPEGSGLRLWVLIDDRECLSCLEELQAIARLAERFASGRLSPVIVALGDRHEARRTLLGAEPGLPVVVSAADDLAGRVFEAATPLKVLTWHDRVVGVVERAADRPGGRAELSDLLGRWAGRG